jgi:DNA topoisomerase-1
VIVNQLDQIEEKYHNHPKTPYVKKESRWGKKKKEKTEKKPVKKKTARTQAAHKLSPELAAVVGAPALSRPETTKKIWEYIKAHNLQSPKNKRLIVPDALLSKVFGNKEPLDMMQLARILGPHFLD